MQESPHDCGLSANRGAGICLTGDRAQRAEPTRDLPRRLEQTEVPAVNHSYTTADVSAALRSAPTTCSRSSAVRLGNIGRLSTFSAALSAIGKSPAR
jgi:hypothetical protein